MNENEVVEQLENIHKSDSTKGERHYARKFKSVYEIVRKSLVVIRKGRKETGSEKAVELTREVLQTALDSLE